MGDAKKQPIVISREDLYGRVWSMPMRELATQFGITGTGLAKICSRLDVPCPPRGYWAKKATGKPVVQFRLPQPKADTPLNVRITPTPPPAVLTPIDAEREQEVETAKQPFATVTVPAELRCPHPIVAGWLAEHKRKAQEARRERNPDRRHWMEPAPITETDDRRHRFLDTLFKALERSGFAVRQEDHQPTFLEIDDERVDFLLREKQKQVRRPLTEEERRWSWNRDRPWTQELQPTGMLVFTIKTRLEDGMRHEWKDDADRPLESCLIEILATISLAGPILTKRRQRHAEAERQRLEKEHQQYLERRDREQDQKRWQCFLQFAKQCDRAASARRLMTELENRLPAEDVTVGDMTARDWLAWCRKWLNRYDPLERKPEEVFEQLANTNAYTSIEELAWVSENLPDH